ncbi:ATPase [Aminithiophilus ramosus]|uniref:ATPase n=2 Tax=Synergistales TaxID=649776 RepID=A0A9Q7EZ07_9BACT|nr:V-type ATPase 116kDa subunit family protein [Aminithiophilus ramosus]QTX31722.1 ATPase [Aminithiophilus ramosus]QVL35545.1 ATPase [Synergistota bacterium]
MALLKMKALSLIGPLEEVEGMARHLLLKGAFQPLPLGLCVSDASLRAGLSTVRENPYEEPLEQLEAVWRLARREIPEARPLSVDVELTPSRAKSLVDQVAGKLTLWHRRSQELTDSMETLEAGCIFLEALARLRRDPRDLSEARHLSVLFGRIDEDNWQRLRESSRDAPLILLDLALRGRQRWILAVTVPGYLEGAQRLLDSLLFKVYPLDDLPGGSASEALARLRRRQSHHKRAVEGLRTAVQTYLDSHEEELAALHSRLHSGQRIWEICREGGQMGRLHLVSGWLPADELPQLREEMARRAPRTVLVAADPEPEQIERGLVPSMLKNLPLVRAFQDIVALYSLPSYGERDPSFVVAVTFCLFFGFMFGDVGHGALLALGAWWLTRRGTLSRGLGAVVQLAGVVSALFGFLYGSVMGKEDLIEPLWLSPMHDTSSLIAASLVTGVVCLSVAMILGLQESWKERDWGEFLLGERGVAGLLLYWSAVLLGVSALTGWGGDAVFGPLLSVTVTLAVLFLLAGIVPLPGRKGKKRGSAAVEGFSRFHHLFSFLSNTASFVRLAAFALNHAGLSMAVFLLADQAAALPGGLILRWLLLVLGNLLIVLLEGLIVFIQTLRLEYYELFGKFFRGGGRPFRPVPWGRPAASLYRYEKLKKGVSS